MPAAPRKPIHHQLNAIHATFQNGASINAGSPNDIRSVEAQKRLKKMQLRKFDKRI